MWLLDDSLKPVPLSNGTMCTTVGKSFDHIERIEVRREEDPGVPSAHVVASYTYTASTKRVVDVIDVPVPECRGGGA